MPDSNPLQLVDSLRVLREARTDNDVIVTTMGTAREWMALGELHPCDFVLVPSSMGQATTLGLGLAIAQPDRNIIVCNGDGSMLMNLGSLVTVAAQAPQNYTLLLFDNGVYEITGAQPTAGNPAIRNDSRSVDFPALATAAGFEQVVTFDSADDWHSSARKLIDSNGPTFAYLPVAPIPGAVGPKSPSPGADRARKFRSAMLAPSLNPEP